MATVTPIYTNPTFTFPRSYLKGFVGSSDCSQFQIIGAYLNFYYLYPHYFCQFKIRTEVFQPSSNVYTLDYVFDWSVSEVALDGVPISTSIGIKWHAMQSEPNWRIQVLATLPVLETQTANLPPLAGYWRSPV